MADEADETVDETAPCTACGAEISTEIYRCPECGHHPQIEGWKRRTGLVLAAMVAVIVSGLVNPGLLILAFPLAFITGAVVMWLEIKAKRRRPTTH